MTESDKPGYAGFFSKAEEVLIMDVTAIGQLIANIGFPCACVVALFVMWQKETERHREEMGEITRALNDNTLVMQRLLDKLEGGSL